MKIVKIDWEEFEEEDISSDIFVEDSLEADELGSWEAGFIHGYNAG